MLTTHVVEEGLAAFKSQFDEKLLEGEIGLPSLVAPCSSGERGVMSIEEAAPALYQADTIHHSGDLGQVTSSHVPQCPQLCMHASHYLASL